MGPRSPEGALLGSGTQPRTASAPSLLPRPPILELSLQGVTSSLTIPTPTATHPEVSLPAYPMDLNLAGRVGTLPVIRGGGGGKRM